MDKISIENSIMLINAARQTFNMQEIQNRRFMYNPDTCTLILGRQYSPKNLMTGSHAEEHGKTGASEPFDSFIRGWIGTGRSYKHGVIHFAPNIDGKNPDIFVDAYNTLQMFRENGADADTVIRGFGKAWEQPLSDVLPGLTEQTKEKGKDELSIKVNAMEETFDPVILLNKPAIFTSLRVDRDTVPAGLFAYDIRHGDNGRASTVEKSVTANHMGTVITSADLDFKKKDYISLNARNGGLNFASEHDCTTVAGYMEHIKGEKAVTEYYGVWAVRSAASVAGHAEAWSKDDGIPLVFTSQEAAERQAAQYNENTASRNVHYSAKEMEPEIALNALKERKKTLAAEANSQSVYVYPAAYAREHGELPQYRQSNRLNRECAQAIDETVRENWNGSRLNPDCTRTVIEKYGLERVNAVLANTVHQKEYDSRFSRDNRDWANSFPRLEKGLDFYADAHPVKLDEFIKQAREAGEIERSGRTLPEDVRGYVISRAILFDNDRGFAFGENPYAASPFVTWQFTRDNGAFDFYWGHYHSAEAATVTDYRNRVSEYMQDYPSLKEIPVTLSPKPEPPYVDGCNIASACNSRYQGMVAFVGMDDKVYLGKSENYDSMGHYDNSDRSLLHMSDNKNVYQFLYGDGQLSSQAEALAYYDTMEDYAEFARVQDRLSGRFNKTKDFLFNGEPFLPPDSEAFKEQVTELERNGGAKPFREHIAEKFGERPNEPDKRPSAAAKLEAAKRAVKPPAPGGSHKKKDIEME